MGATEFIKRPEFYLKVIECVLCIVGTIFVVQGSVLYSNYDKATDITVMLAIPNSIITTAVLAVLIVVEAQHHFTEIILNGTSAVLNLVVGLLFFIHISKSSSNNVIVVGVTATVCGLVMLIDVIREIIKG